MLEVFVERARHLSAARALVADDAEYTAALALLSVYSAISWNDAIAVKLNGRAVKGQNHMIAVSVMERQCGVRRLNRDGLKHLRKLIQEKSKVSYGDQRITAEAALALAVNSERFEKWAIQILGRL